MKPALFLVALIFSTFTAQADNTIYIAADETKALEAKEGQKITVHGRTKGSGKSSAGTNFVNFVGADFYLVTFKTDLAGFPEGEPSDIYEAKHVAVTGTISIHKGKPQIKLTSPDQVKIITEEEIFPPRQDVPIPSVSEEPATPAATDTEQPKEEPKTEKPKPPVDPSQYFKD